MKRTDVYQAICLCVGSDGKEVLQLRIRGPLLETINPDSLHFGCMIYDFSKNDLEIIAGIIGVCNLIRASANAKTLNRAESIIETVLTEGKSQGCVCQGVARILLNGGVPSFQ